MLYEIIYIEDQLLKFVYVCLTQQQAKDYADEHARPEDLLYYTQTLEVTYK